MSKKTRDPLYRVWRDRLKFPTLELGRLCDSWANDFLLFKAELPVRELSYAKLAPIDQSMPLQTGNVQWIHSGRKVHWTHRTVRESFKKSDSYAEVVIQQDNSCAICIMRKRLVVDHDHETLKIRGLLCTTCNTALGLMSDDPQLLRRAADYLEAHSSVQMKLEQIQLADENAGGK